MENVGISQANKAYLDKKQTKTNQKASNHNVEMKKDGNKKLKMALAGLAVAGAAIAAGVIVKRRVDAKALQNAGEAIKNGADGLQEAAARGAESAKDVAQSAAESVSAKAKTTFFNKAGEEVSVAFPKSEKGIAKVNDELFTGTLKQVRTKDGKTIETLVEYVDGKPMKTTIDGITKKTFEYGADGTKTIKRLAQDGSTEKLTTLYKGSDGKTNRIFEQIANDTDAPFGKAIYFDEGKVRARATFKGDGTLIDKCTVYDADGKVAKEITSIPGESMKNQLQIKEYLPNGGGMWGMGCEFKPNDSVSDITLGYLQNLGRSQR